MAFTYYLPDENGNKFEHHTDFNSVVIIGANGSGKSKLGAWIEQQDMENIHRIGAQRNLNFQENLPLKSYSQAEELVFYGSNEKSHHKTKSQRWNWGKSYTTKLMDDFDNVLAALIALKNNDNDRYVKECKAASTRAERPDPPITVIDKLIQIWDEIFPQRQLELIDAKFLASLRDETGIKYNSNQMSDGERAVLYLAAQVLCVPTDKMLIIDEPEVHLHRSIMNCLWIALERYRSDCLFIYITHDTQFAATHGQADKIWIKAFDGTKWEFEKIQDNELPEELLFDILGSRKNVLFVEGESSSYDTQLYSVLYPTYHVVACGSCTQVIARVKAFRRCQALHECAVYGIIDRDYRSDYEIDKYKSDNIYTLEVAEVENLFLVEELIRIMAESLGENPDVVLTKVKQYIVQQRFSRQIDKQVCQSVVANLKYRLSTAELSKKTEIEAKESLNAVLQSLDYEQVKTAEETRFREALGSDDYKNVLRVFNEKSLVSSIGNFFNIKNEAYCTKVINLLRGEKHDAIVAALAPYLPAEIQR